jgi:TPR repeat protein
LNGSYIKEDLNLAKKLFTLSADQGLADAQVELGAMYGKGLGMPADRVKSVELYKLAAEQGVAIANFNLGVVYINGDGIEPDIDLGVSYMLQAAVLGMEEAEEILVELKNKYGIESE